MPGPQMIQKGAMLIGGALFLLATLLSLGGAGVELRAGHELPAIAVSRQAGDELTLHEAAVGRDEVIVVTPSCDVCAAELERLVGEVARARGEGGPDPLERVLLLVVRGQGLPRSGFMAAYTELIDFGLEAVFVDPAIAREMGIERVPVFVRMDEEGLIASVDYPEAG